MDIESVPINLLVPDPNNTRVHGEKNLKAIKGSINLFGVVEPLIVQRGTNLVIGGNGRLEVLKNLGHETVPVNYVDLSDSKAKALSQALNRTAELAEWDMEALGATLQGLREDGLDLSEIGFDVDDLSDILPDPEVTGLTEEDEIPENVETRCKPGDLWTLGNHRLLCGDSTNIQHVERLMGGGKADMVFTDPPYGIDEATDRVEHVKTFKKQGIAKKGSYSKIVGDTSIDTAVAVFNLIEALSVPIVVYWGGNYYAHELPNSPCWIVWDKRVEDSQRDLNSDCELAWVKHPHKASVRIFRHLWKGMIKASEQGQARVHPTQKPIALAEWCIAELDPKGSSVLDLFLGSGSTLIACEKTNRKCYGMEIDPKYCDVILSRWEKFTGKKAVLSDS